MITWLDRALLCVVCIKANSLLYRVRWSTWKKSKKNQSTVKSILLLTFVLKSKNYCLQVSLLRYFMWVENSREIEISFIAYPNIVNMQMSEYNVKFVGFPYTNTLYCSICWYTYSQVRKEACIPFFPYLDATTTTRTEENFLFLEHDKFVTHTLTCCLITLKFTFNIYLLHDDTTQRVHWNIKKFRNFLHLDIFVHFCLIFINERKKKRFSLSHTEIVRKMRSISC